MITVKEETITVIIKSVNIAVVFGEIRVSFFITLLVYIFVNVLIDIH